MYIKKYIHTFYFKFKGLFKYLTISSLWHMVGSGFYPSTYISVVRDKSHSNKRSAFTNCPE